jgi:hypothetical protein
LRRLLGSNSSSPMLLRVLLDLLILAIMVTFSTSQNPPCYICGPGYMIANPSIFVTFQDGTSKACGTIESEALNGYYLEGYCLQFQQYIPPICWCQQIQAVPTMPQQSPTAPATAPHQPRTPTTTTLSASTTSAGAIVGYIFGGLLLSGLGIAFIKFRNAGTFNCFQCDCRK